MLPSMAKTQSLTDKTTAWLEENNLSYIDLSEHFSGRSPESMVVNPLDGHPNTEINEEVGKLLYENLLEVLNNE